MSNPEDDAEYAARAERSWRGAGEYANLGKPDGDDGDDAPPGSKVEMQHGGSTVRYEAPAGGSMFVVGRGRMIIDEEVQLPTDSATESTGMQMGPDGRLHPIEPKRPDGPESRSSNEGN